MYECDKILYSWIHDLLDVDLSLFQVIYQWEILWGWENVLESFWVEEKPSIYSVLFICKEALLACVSKHRQIYGFRLHRMREAYMDHIWEQCHGFKVSFLCNIAYVMTRIRTCEPSLDKVVILSCVAYSNEHLNWDGVFYMHVAYVRIACTCNHVRKCWLFNPKIRIFKCLSSNPRLQFWEARLPLWSLSHKHLNSLIWYPTLDQLLHH